jgi:uncharacterized OB-fold protein
MSVYEKPLPDPTDGSQPFWDACRRHELVMQECVGCGHRRWPIGPACTNCLSADARWIEVSGTGEIWSWIVYHQAFNRAFVEDVPYNVALIRMDEGHTMISNVVGVEPSELEVGQRVEVVFDDVTDEISVPRFRVVQP